MSSGRTRRRGLRPHRRLVPQTGGLAIELCAEALLWSRIGISLWVEIFKDHIRTRGTSLGEATRHGFQRSMARYFGRAGRAAFNMATRGGGTWTEVQQRTHLGCSDDGVCSEDELTDELRTFVKDVEPVLDQMVKLQKSAGLEDPRTP